METRIRYSLKGKGLTTIIDKIPEECWKGARSHEDVKANYYISKGIDWREVKPGDTIDYYEQEEA